jgi:hypothetical protein
VVSGDGMGGGRRGGRAGGSEGESITLMDVKVGDTVAGKGGMKGGFFVPTELGVMTPRAGGGERRRRPRGDGSGAPAGAASPDAGSVPN